MSAVCRWTWFDCAYLLAFFLLNCWTKNFPMKTVIYVLAGAIALSSVGCTAGRKERQAKAEPPSSSKAVAKTRTSARAVLGSSTKPAPAVSQKATTKDSGGAKTSVSKTAPRVAKDDSRAEASLATPKTAPKTAVAKVAAKPSPKADSKPNSRATAGVDSGALSFNAPAVDAVAPMPKPVSTKNRVVIPPKLVRVGAQNEAEKTPAATSSSIPEKSKDAVPSTVAKSTPKASKEEVQSELNKALADAGSDARAVVGSLVPTAGSAAAKPSVVEDDAPSTSDNSTVVKSPATMKSSDAGAPPAVVDSKGEVKEATVAPSVASAATSSKGADPASDAKPSVADAAVASTTLDPVAASVPPPPTPKKPVSALEKKEMIATALRDGNEALKSEDSAKALELFESVVKQDKDQRDAWFRIGYLKEMSGDIQGAIKAFREVKRILAN